MAKARKAILDTLNRQLEAGEDAEDLILEEANVIITCFVPATAVL